MRGLDCSLSQKSEHALICTLSSEGEVEGEGQDEVEGKQAEQVGWRPSPRQIFFVVGVFVVVYEKHLIFIFKLVEEKNIIDENMKCGQCIFRKML